MLKKISLACIISFSFSTMESMEPTEDLKKVMVKKVELRAQKNFFNLAFCYAFNALEYFGAKVHLNTKSQTTISQFKNIFLSQVFLRESEEEKFSILKTWRKKGCNLDQWPMVRQEYDALTWLQKYLEKK